MSESTAETTGLAVYGFGTCPFCAKVRDAERRLGIELEWRDVLAEPGHRDALVEATGRQTVPCLRIEDDQGVRWMHESDAIVAYLEERFGRAA